MTAHTMLLLLPSLLFVLSACTTTRSSTYTIRQTGMMPTASAPHIVGAPRPLKTFSIDAGAFHALDTGERATGGDNPTGSVVAGSGGRIAFVAGSGASFEVGGSLEVRPGGRARPLSAELNRERYDSELGFYASALTRLHVDDGKASAFSLSIEAGIGGAAYERQTSSNETVYPPGDGSEWEPDPISTSSSERDDGQTTVVLLRVGPAWHMRFGDALVVSLGLVVGNQPHVRAAVSVSEWCHDGFFSDESCDGETPEDVPVVSHSFALVPHLSLTLHLGDHLTVTPRAYALLVANDAQRDAMPAGFELLVGMRF